MPLISGQKDDPAVFVLLSPAAISCFPCCRVLSSAPCMHVSILSKKIMYWKLQFIQTSSNLQWNCHHSIYAYETVFCSSDPPPASYSTPDRSELNSGMAVWSSAHYLKGWKLLGMVASHWMWYHLMQDTAVLIRCTVGFRFKGIVENLGEIKRVAFQPPPAMSTLTKVL